MERRSKSDSVNGCSSELKSGDFTVKQRKLVLTKQTSHAVDGLWAPSFVSSRRLKSRLEEIHPPTRLIHGIIRCICSCAYSLLVLSLVSSVLLIYCIVNDIHSPHSISHLIHGAGAHVDCWTPS